MKCAFCDKEIIFKGKEDDGMVMNTKTEGRCVHDSCYKQKFGSDPLEDMKVCCTVCGCACSNCECRDGCCTKCKCCQGKKDND